MKVAYPDSQIHLASMALQECLMNLERLRDGDAALDLYRDTPITNLTLAHGHATCWAYILSGAAAGVFGN